MVTQVSFQPTSSNTSKQEIKMRPTKNKQTVKALAQLDYQERVYRIEKEAKRRTGISHSPKLEAVVHESLATIGDAVARSKVLYLTPKQLKIHYERLIDTIAKRDGISEDLVLEAKELLSHARKYSTVFYRGVKSIPELPSNTNPENYPELQKYCTPEKVPDQIIDIDIGKPHSIPCNEYLDVRVSGEIQHLLNKQIETGKNVEIFLGSSEDQGLFYLTKGYRPIAILSTESSIKYTLVQKGDDPSDIMVVISGISNNSKLTHSFLQLKYLGIDMKKVLIRGSLTEAFQIMDSKLHEKLSSLEAPLELAFMGCRWQAMLEIAEELYPNEFIGLPPSSVSEDRWIKTKKLLTERNGYKEINIDNVFSFSYVEITDAHNQKKGIVAFRMPNGDLSSIATQELIKQHVKYFVTTGAGGSLDPQRTIGSYQLLDVAKHDNRTIDIRELPALMNLKISPEIPFFTHGRNITVDSPLTETKEWLDSTKRESLTSVDVETFYIFDALQKASDSDKQKMNILPGIFTSDIVGEIPLVDKICPDAAFIFLCNLIRSCLTQLQLINVRV